jgi:two-component system response regulator
MSVDTIINKQRPAEVLLVEDNPGDAILTKKAFAAAKISNNITVASDGERALAMLHHEAPYQNTPMPDLILLDLNLPKISGKEVLAEIKADDKLKHIPVIILTSSRAEVDVMKSYDLHANSYIVKPVDSKQFSEVARTIEQFWFSLVILPDDKTAEDAVE